MTHERGVFAYGDGEGSKESDEGLLLRMLDRERNPEAAQAACKVFFERHAEFLRLACEKYSLSHSVLPPEDLVVQVMVEIYFGRATYTAPTTCKPEDERRSVRGWLIGVARNQFGTHLRKERIDLCGVPPSEKLKYDVTPTLFGENDESGALPAQRNKILEFREGLSHEKKIIFDRSIQYYDPVTCQFVVPPAVANEIAGLVLKTIPTVRKIRERMMADLRAFVNKEAS
jgi:DNA-directed RNA polymerase specialized sigma24 family protein